MKQVCMSHISIHILLGRKKINKEEDEESIRFIKLKG